MCSSMSVPKRTGMRPAVGIRSFDDKWQAHWSCTLIWSYNQWDAWIPYLSSPWIPAANSAHVASEHRTRRLPLGTPGWGEDPNRLCVWDTQVLELRMPLSKLYMKIRICPETWTIICYGGHRIRETDGRRLRECLISILKVSQT